MTLERDVAVHYLYTVGIGSLLTRRVRSHGDHQPMLAAPVVGVYGCFGKPITSGVDPV